MYLEKLWDRTIDRYVLAFLLCTMPFVIHFMFVTCVTFWIKSLNIDTGLQTLRAIVHDKISKNVWNFDIYPPALSILHTSRSLQYNISHLKLGVGLLNTSFKGGHSSPRKNINRNHMV